MKWVEYQCIEVDILIEKLIIFLCDNFFGRFGNCVFLQIEFEYIEKNLKLIVSFKEKIKIVIVIYVYVYDELRSNLKFKFFK